MYDYLIVGSGLFGSVFAHEAYKRGYKCLVIEKRGHIGGNIYTQKVEGINIHRYGAHIFHTSNEYIWNYVNSFTKFNGYINSPIANYKGELFNLPFNMNTFYQLWGVKTPEQAISKIQEQVKRAGIKIPRNLEEQALSMVGKDIYLKLIKGYTEKQWGRIATELPPFIIKRLPLRFKFDNNYFNDRYQGIPEGGYNKIIDGLLSGIEIKTGIDYLTDKDYWDSISVKVIFTGPIDAFYNYKFGSLEYRSLEFKDEFLEIHNYQGNAVINYTDAETPYTRIIEHKHFEFGKQPYTIITREYPKEWKIGNDPYYPINNETNNKRYKKYQQLALKEKNVLFGGRLAEYKYYDMHQVIGSALTKVKKELDN